MGGDGWVGEERIVKRGKMCKWEKEWEGWGGRGLGYPNFVVHVLC